MMKRMFLLLTIVIIATLDCGCSETPKPTEVATESSLYNPFGKPAYEVAEYINDKCSMTFVWSNDFNLFTQYHVWDGIGFGISSDLHSPNSSVGAIMVFIDFGGEFTEEPNTDLLNEFTECMENNTGVPFHYVLEWASDNKADIVERGMDGRKGTKDQYIFLAIYSDVETMIITIGEKPTTTREGE